MIYVVAAALFLPFLAAAVGATTAWGVIQSLLGTDRNRWRRGVEMVIRTAERRSSSDSEIREVEAHDLAPLVADLPELRMIAFNGGTAAAIGRRQLSPPLGIAFGVGTRVEGWLRAAGVVRRFSA